jgi:hypothetical protein
VKRLIGMMLVLVVLALAPAALAQDPTVSAYGGAAGDVRGALDETPTVRTLPFTGLDVALVVAAGLVLVALGVGLRQTARNRA